MKQEEVLALPASVLKQDQREIYFERGCLAFPGLVGDEWLNPLREALAEIVEQTRHYQSSTRRVDIEPNHSADNPRLRRVAYLDEFAPVFWELCTNSVIPNIATDLLGPNLKFRELMMNFKWADGGAEVKWHQDIVFYPHTHSGTLQFLLMLDGAELDQGPLQVIPGSHKGPIFRHYDHQDNWTGTISENDLNSVAMDKVETIVGPPGTLSVHHSRTIHGSMRNMSANGRPAFVVTYSAADAMPYTAPAYPSVNYHHLVRGIQPRYAHHEEMAVPLPPDWSDGYTSIFEHQHEELEDAVA